MAMATQMEGEIRLKSLKKFRLAMGLTQKQLAALLGISERQVSRYESLFSCPRGPVLRRMCKLFGCTDIQLMRAPRARAQARMVA